MNNALLEALRSGEKSLEAGNMDLAMAHFLKARSLDPQNVSVGLAVANLYRLKEDNRASLDVLMDCFRSGDYNSPGAAHSLGGALLEAGAVSEAVKCFRKVSEALPNDPAALSALASALRASGKSQEAWPWVMKAIRLAPEEPGILLTAGQIRHELGDLRGAMKWIQKSLDKRPGHKATLVQKAYSSLMSEIGDESWRLFESRPLPVPSNGSLRWNGEPLDNKSILITAEQGVGDQFQFLRFIKHPAISSNARKIVVECHRDAVILLKSNGFNAIERGEKYESDFHVPLLSLPHVLKTSNDVWASSVAYIKATERCNTDLPTSNGKPRLGLVWAGNPEFTGRFTRDLDPSLLPQIASIENINWISLQQGPAGKTKVDGISYLEPLTSWQETASVLSELDGLVTTDTGIAHLAGAMGIKTWVMLRKVPDWRWGLTGDSSSWYPTMSLVRQEEDGDWKSVVDQLKQMICDI